MIGLIDYDDCFGWLGWWVVDLVRLAWLAWVLSGLVVCLVGLAFLGRALNSGWLVLLGGIQVESLVFTYKIENLKTIKCRT